MSHGVDSLAYNKVEVPWHTLGKPVNGDLSPEEMGKEAGVLWSVSKRDLYLKGAKKPIAGQYALCRDDNDRVLSIVGRNWKPVQNVAALDFFKKFVEAGHMTMETVGSLWEGRYIWALAKIGKDFSLKKGDEVRSYLLISSPHVRGKALVIQYTPIRVVCWNTLTFALGRELKGGKHGFRMPHTMVFDEVVRKSAEEALGLAVHQQEEFKEAALLLSRKKAPEAEVNQYFCQILKFDPTKAKLKKNEEPKTPRLLPMFQQALVKAPGQQLSTAAGTWWGALNAVTYVVDHETGREPSTALKSIWLGSKSRMKRNALELALKKAA